MGGRYYFGNVPKKKFLALVLDLGLGEQIDCQTAEEESIAIVLFIIGGVLVVGLLGWIALRFL